MDIWINDKKIALLVVIKLKTLNKLDSSFPADSLWLIYRVPELQSIHPFKNRCWTDRGFLQLCKVNTGSTCLIFTNVNRTCINCNYVSISSEHFVKYSNKTVW